MSRTHHLESHRQSVTRTIQQNGTQPGTMLLERTMKIIARKNFQVTMTLSMGCLSSGARVPRQSPTGLS